MGDTDKRVEVEKEYLVKETVVRERMTREGGDGARIKSIWHIDGKYSKW